MTQKTDVAIVGAGIAGIATALDLLDRNIRVTLLDRNGPERFGGLAVESFGGIFFVGTPQQKRLGIADSPELAFQDWLSFGEIHEKDKIARKWAETYVHTNYEKVFLWLRAKKVGFFPVVHWVERGLHRPGNSVPRFHMVWGTGSGLMERLISQLKSHPNVSNLNIHFHHRVDAIQGVPNRVESITGVNEKTGEPFQYLAPHIVIGSGGFGGNIAEVKKHWYWDKVPEVILNGSHPSADGRMHQVVEKLGGKLVNMKKMWMYAAGVHHPRPGFEGHGLSLVPPRSALWVSAKGKRIGPTPLVTGFDTRYLVERITAQDEPHTWLVLNKKIAVKELGVSGSEFNTAIRDKKLLAFLVTVLFGNHSLVADLLEHCKDFLVADTVSELVNKMNRLTDKGHVNGDLLKLEIERYDGQIQRGLKYHNDDQLRRIAQLRNYRGDRVRTCKFQAIEDKKAIPLIAIRVFPLSRKSLGGIQTDMSSRVLDSEQQPISGLYAVGEAAGFGGGGIHGIRALEGTFLGSCILTGRHAAEAIMEEL